MGKKKEFDFDAIRKMDKDQQQQVVRAMAKTANRRLNELEKKDLFSYAGDSTKSYLKANGQTRFYTGKKVLNEKALRHELNELDFFLNAVSSTVSGVNKINKKRLNTLRSDVIDANGKVIRAGFEIKAKDEKLFFRFLSSNQFKELCKSIDSDQVIEDFLTARDDGETIKEIHNAYEEYLTTEMTFEQVAEKRAKKQLLQNVKKTAKKLVK